MQTRRRPRRRSPTPRRRAYAAAREGEELRERGSPELPGHRSGSPRSSSRPIADPETPAEGPAGSHGPRAPGRSARRAYGGSNPEQRTWEERPARYNAVRVIVNEAPSSSAGGRSRDVGTCHELPPAFRRELRERFVEERAHLPLARGREMAAVVPGDPRPPPVLPERADLAARHHAVGEAAEEVATLPRDPRRRRGRRDDAEHAP